MFVLCAMKESTVPTSIGAVSAASVCTAATADVKPPTSAARRRRPGPARARPLRSVTSQAAAEKIASLAEVKKAYYMEKLAMKREQHAQKLKVLELQHKIAIKQLNQLEE